MTFHNHSTPMNFKSVFAAGLLALSTIAPVAAQQAPNGWVRIGTGAGTKSTLYERFLSRNNHRVVVTRRWSDMPGDKFRIELDCRRWGENYLGKADFTESMPGTMGDSSLRYWCGG